MHLPLGLLSPPLFSLTIPKREYKKDKNATETSHKKFSEGQQAHVGMVSLVGCFFRLPSLHVLVFLQKTFCDLLLMFMRGNANLFVQSPS